MKLNNYRTIVFDCDGVILNSNSIKSEAFKLAVINYGQKAAEELLEYHQRNGGISRYKKFEYFIANILGQPVEDNDVENLSNIFADLVVEGLRKCEIADGLRELREQLSEPRWVIASGGNQNELRHIFASRGLSDLFDGGIFGSPTPKEEILRMLVDKGDIEYPALFLGDSKYDYQVATQYDLDFIFVSEWTEVSDWKEFIQEYELKSVKRVSDLLDSGQSFK